MRKRRVPSSILGLALDGNRLEGAVLRRSNGSLQVQPPFAVSLALPPLSSDPELVGREIRNHLDQAGIHERRCAVCLPLSSALTIVTEVPDLPDEDVANLLQLEAERGFPYSQDALLISTLRFRSPSGKQYATLIAVPKNDVLPLEKALRTTQLKPLSFTLGVSVLQNPKHDSSHGVLALVIGENSVDLQVTCGGGIVALRSLDGAFETEGMQKTLATDLVAREIRVTLGQLPAEFREAIGQVNVFGRGEQVRRFVSDIGPRLESMGLKVELVSGYPANAFAKKLPPGTEVSPAVSIAAVLLSGAAPPLEFLPPKTKPWQQLTTRFSARKLAWIGAAACLLLLLSAGSLAYQQWQLTRLNRQWTAMEPTVKDLQDLQLRIKKFRPWFDNSFRSLAILRKLTEAFPEEGVVSAKTLEIRELSSVTCSGVARDNQAFLQMLDQLRAMKEVTDLKVDMVRGKTPMQFTFNFHWGERANEN